MSLMVTVADVIISDPTTVDDEKCKPASRRR